MTRYIDAIRALTREGELEAQTIYRAKIKLAIEDAATIGLTRTSVDLPASVTVTRTLTTWLEAEGFKFTADTLSGTLEITWTADTGAIK